MKNKFNPIFVLQSCFCFSFYTSEYGCVKLVVVSYFLLVMIKMSKGVKVEF